MAAKRTENQVFFRDDPCLRLLISKSSSLNTYMYYIQAILNALSKNRLCIHIYIYNNYY